MNRHKIAELARQCPEDISWREAIYVLYAIQHYESMNAEYAPNIFYNQIFGIITGLQNSASRKTILKQLGEPACIAYECNNPVKVYGSTLDHLIPKSRGGPENIENTLSLCRNHNSSKGSKDLLDWWGYMEWPASSLPRSSLCIYSRLMWKYLDDLIGYPQTPTNAVKLFISHRSQNLPTDDHRLALYGSTYAAMAFLSWERMHEARATVC